MGRSKIHVQRIDHARNRHNTYVKRAEGVFSKMNELNRLCGAHVVSLTVNDRGDIAKFFSTIGGDQASLEFMEKVLKSGYVERRTPQDYIPYYKKDKKGVEWLSYKPRTKVSYVYKAEDRHAGRKGTNGPKKSKTPLAQIEQPVQPSVLTKMAAKRLELAKRRATTTRELNGKKTVTYTTEENAPAEFTAPEPEKTKSEQQPKFIKAVPTEKYKETLDIELNVIKQKFDYNLQHIDFAFLDTSCLMGLSNMFQNMCRTTTIEKGHSPAPSVTPQPTSTIDVDGIEWETVQ